MGYVLLAFWWFLVAVTIGGLVLLALAILSGVLIAVGVACSTLWGVLRTGRWEKRVPRWASFLDEF